MASVFPTVFLAAAAVLAVWVDSRFPRLAPASLARRGAAALAAVIVLHLAPLSGGSALRVYVTLFGVLLPAFVVAFLTGMWLLRALRDAQLAR